jgi:hypothetical protein
LELIFAIIIVIVCIIIALHLRPLEEHEVKSLSTKRRNKSVESYFLSDDVEHSVNSEFKNKLNPNGVFYQVDLSLHTVAATVAALLKYKKHEWIIIAFEKHKKVHRLWVNKGHNNSSASIYLPLNQSLEVALQNGYSSILMFHNHPNSDPSKYDCTQASKTDLDTAAHWADRLNPGGINLIEYVCERGRHYRYFLSPSDSFLPLNCFIEEIDKTNGHSLLGNLRLHFERIF